MTLKITLLSLFMALTMSANSQTKEKTPNTTAESVAIVNLQLVAYNTRDIEKFLETFSEDVEIYRNGTLTMTGREQMRAVYAPMFDNTPNLHCIIVNRITINNKVIDNENVTSNDRIIEAVAMYEVADGLIQKVTFVN